MIEKPATNPGQIIWSGVLAVSAIACVFAWSGRMSKLHEIERQQAYIVAAEGFRVMHHDSQIPLIAKNLDWSAKGHDLFVLEADGIQHLGKKDVPKRWSVTLRHADNTWSIVESKWK